MRIIVSMTSWLLRIDNLAPVLKTILQQTVKPDLIEINLSLDEFPNKEDNLPAELIQLMKDNPIIEINWCEGNTKAFKKIIPTLQKFYGEEYYLISIDDDLLYDRSFIGRSISELERLGVDAFNFSGTLIYGNREIYRSSIFTPDFWENLTPQDIATNHDDGYIYYYLKYIKGAKFANRILKGRQLFTDYNSVYPSRAQGTYFPFSEAKEVFGKNLPN